jgi:hypothetical protein
MQKISNFNIWKTRMSAQPMAEQDSRNFSSQHCEIVVTLDFAAIEVAAVGRRAGRPWWPAFTVRASLKAG